MGDGPRAPFFALVDTGADDSKMTFSQAERLGVVLDRTQPILFESATGSAIGYFGEVTLELRQSPVSYVWKAQVSFLPTPKTTSSEEEAKVVLGHTSFFRYFSVSFDFQRRRLKLRPNRLFVGRPR